MGAADVNRAGNSQRLRTLRRVLPGPNAPPVPIAGAPAQGTIVRLFSGQCHGTIRTTAGRDVWFHRNDMRNPVDFNACSVGNAVTFDLIDDRISGARALRVLRLLPQ